MSDFVSTQNERLDIFGNGGGQELAQELEGPFLGEIPLETDVRVGGDEGKPVMVGKPDSAASQAFLEIAKKLAAQVSIQSMQPVGAAS